MNNSTADNMINQLMGIMTNMTTAGIDTLRRGLSLGEFYSFNWGKMITVGFLIWLLGKMLKVKVDAKVGKA